MKTPTLHLDRSYILLYSIDSTHPEVWQNRRQAGPGDAHPPLPGPPRAAAWPSAPVTCRWVVCVCKDRLTSSFSMTGWTLLSAQRKPSTETLGRITAVFRLQQKYQQADTWHWVWAVLSSDTWTVSFHFSDNSGKLIQKVWLFPFYRNDSGDLKNYLTISRTVTK